MRRLSDQIRYTEVVALIDLSRDSMGGQYAQDFICDLGLRRQKTIESVLVPWELILVLFVCYNNLERSSVRSENLNINRIFGGGLRFPVHCDLISLTFYGNTDVLEVIYDFLWKSQTAM